MRTLLLASLFLAAGSAAVAEDAATATLLPPPDTTPVMAIEDAPKTVLIPMLKQAVQKGETITDGNIVMTEVPTSQAFVSTVKDANELVGQQAMRPLMAGTAISKLHVRVAPVVSKNQTVMFVYRKGGVELTGRGQALDDGQTGQSIRVINSATRSTVVGIVAANGTVEMN